jgi:CubicO group peptidase (beta-lactamase class C family)
MRWLVVSVAAAVAGCTGARGGGFAATDDLAPALEPIRAAEQLPALGMAVWRGDTLVAIGMTGTRKAGDPAHPATVDDLWHLGSDTKAMTATLIAIYVDRGVLHWDDTIATRFAGEAIDPGYAAVTLDQLLQHRGGAPAKLPEGMDDASRADLVRAILGKPPAQAVGTFKYSNAGYIIAGAALERATGKTWEELIRTDLFGPLGMTSCGFGAPGSAAAVDQPWGHTASAAWGGAVTNQPIAPDNPGADNPPSVGPAGTVHCTLRDWGKFLTIHLGAPSSLVSAASLAHLHQPPRGEGQSYMGGWMLMKGDAGDIRYGHEGSNTMWHAIALVAPARGVAIAVVANRSDANLFTAIKPVMDRYLAPAPR